MYRLYIVVLACLSWLMTCIVSLQCAIMRSHDLSMYHADALETRLVDFTSAVWDDGKQFWLYAQSIMIACIDGLGVGCTRKSHIWKLFRPYDFFVPFHPYVYQRQKLWWSIHVQGVHPGVEVANDFKLFFCYFLWVYVYKWPYIWSAGALCNLPIAHRVIHIYSHINSSKKIILIINKIIYDGKYSTLPPWRPHVQKIFHNAWNMFIHVWPVATESDMYEHVSSLVKRVSTKMISQSQDHAYTLHKVMNHHFAY